MKMNKAMNDVASDSSIELLVRHCDSTPQKMVLTAKFLSHAILNEMFGVYGLYLLQFVLKLIGTVGYSMYSVLTLF